jgi:hypothetical protein
MGNIKRGILLLLLIIMLAFPQAVYGYLDPGTGSYVIQIVLAALLSIGVGVRIFWGKIKGIFKKKSPEKIPEKEKVD